jgi:hypothetical protein
VHAAQPKEDMVACLVTLDGPAHAQDPQRSQGQLSGIHRFLLGVQEGVGYVLDGEGIRVGARGAA